MATGNHIEIHRDSHRTRILLPPSAPPRRLRGSARIKAESPMWVRYLLFTAFVGWVAWFMVSYPRMVPLQDRSKGVALGLAMFGCACVVVYATLRRFMAAGRAGTSMMPPRVELIIDRRAVTHSGTGPFLWRMPLKQVRTGSVSTLKRRRQGEHDVVSDDSQELFKATRFGGFRTQAVAQVPLHHRIDGFHLRPLAVSASRLGSGELALHEAAITGCRRLLAWPACAGFDQRVHLQLPPRQAMVGVGVIARISQRNMHSVASACPAEKRFKVAAV